MLFDRTAREQAVEEVRRALVEERHDEERALRLAAMANDFDVPIEYVVQWIHLQPSAKAFSMADFSRFVRQFSRFKRETVAHFAEFVARAEQSAQQASLLDTSPEAFD